MLNVKVKDNIFITRHVTSSPLYIFSKGKLYKNHAVEDEEAVRVKAQYLL